LEYINHPNHSTFLTGLTLSTFWSAFGLFNSLLNILPKLAKSLTSISSLAWSGIMTSNSRKGLRTQSGVFFDPSMSMLWVICQTSSYNGTECFRHLWSNITTLRGHKCLIFTIIKKQTFEWLIHVNPIEQHVLDTNARTQLS